MNIQELAKQAIESINAMSLDELEKKFLEHGYIPSRVESYDYNDVVLQNSEHWIIETLPSCNITSANQPNYFNWTNYDMSIAA